jgi:uncharacterized protein (TIGR00730 family)
MLGMGRIAVFCGSNSGRDPAIREVAVDLGVALAARRHELVYGGARVGLMGAVADAVLAAGGSVIGVITGRLVELEVAHTELTMLEVASTMHERKARMVDLSDGVIVLPGGFGTLDEAFELLTWNQLGLVATPVVFLNIDGFFDPLFEFIEQAVRGGFIATYHGSLAQRAVSVNDAIRRATTPAAPYIAKWVD